jgi:hypothetical protein
MSPSTHHFSVGARPLPLPCLSSYLCPAQLPSVKSAIPSFPWLAWNLSQGLELSREHLNHTVPYAISCLFSLVPKFSSGPVASRKLVWTPLP